jgi:S1-C subfamily serine protease
VEARVELLNHLAQATLTIAAQIPESHPSVAVLGQSRLGTGAVVDRRGFVLTVNYVVVGAEQVMLVDTRGRQHEGILVAHDYASGIALLRVPGLDLTPLEPGDSTMTRGGADVVTIASVGNEERRSMSAVVTSLDPFDAYWEYRLERALWLSAANPGLGGGPVCDARGRILGIASLNLGAVGRATLAIPAECYFAHANELIEKGRRVSRPRRAWLGLFCQAFPERTVVAGVIPGSPGERFGLEVGDIILRVDRTRITARPELYERIWAHQPGEVVEVDVYRKGERETLRIETGDADEFFS